MINDDSPWKPVVNQQPDFAAIMTMILQRAAHRSCARRFCGSTSNSADLRESKREQVYQNTIALFSEQLQ
jgi:hypothetical protein